MSSHGLAHRRQTPVSPALVLKQNVSLQFWDVPLSWIVRILTIRTVAGLQGRSKAVFFSAWNCWIFKTCFLSTMEGSKIGVVRLLRDEICHRLQLESCCDVCIVCFMSRPQCEPQLGPACSQKRRV